MIDTAPLISLPAFIVGFIAVLLIARAIVEVYVKQKKSPQELGGVQASRQAQLSASQKVIQRYYSRKGA